MSVIKIDKKIIINKFLVRDLYDKKIFKTISKNGENLELYRDTKGMYKVVCDGEWVSVTASLVLAVEKFNSYSATAEEPNYWKEETKYRGYI